MIRFAVLSLCLTLAGCDCAEHAAIREQAKHFGVIAYSEDFRDSICSAEDCNGRFDTDECTLFLTGGRHQPICCSSEGCVLYGPASIGWVSGWANGPTAPPASSSSSSSSSSADTRNVAVVAWAALTAALGAAIAFLVGAL